MTDNETIGKRIKSFSDEKKLSIRDIEKKIGVGNGTVSRIVNGSGELGSDKLSNILKEFPEINPTWLLTGKGEMFISEQKKQIVNIDGGKIIPVSINAIQSSIIPLKAMAGPAIEQYMELLKQEVKLLPHLSFRPQLFISVQGDSMQPTLKDGDCVIVSQCFPDEVVDGKVYVVHTNDGEVFIKRVIVDSVKRLYMFVSDNAAKYRPFSKEEHEIFAIFRVIGVVQMLD